MRGKFTSIVPWAAESFLGKGGKGEGEGGVLRRAGERERE